MDVLNWFTLLDHERFLMWTYYCLIALTIINFSTKNYNIAILFLLLLLSNAFGSIGDHYLIDYLNTEEHTPYRWLQFLYFASFNVLTILAIFWRKKILSSFLMGDKYQLYFQEFGIVLIAFVSLTAQLFSMANWLIYYASGEYSLVIHGLYATVQTILLGLMYIILFTLTIQNVFGELIMNRKGILDA